MSEREEKAGPLFGAIMPVLILCCCVVLAPVLIFVLAYAEFRLTRTHYVEDACRRLHIHGAMLRVIRAILP